MRRSAEQWALPPPAHLQQRKEGFRAGYRGLLKLKLQHFGHLMQRADSFEKTLMLGKIEGRDDRG